VVGGMGLGDWVPWKTQTPLDYISTAYLFLDVKILCDAAHVLGLREDEAKYQRLAAKVKAGFHAKFYNPQSQVYANGSQTALSIALFFDLAPADVRPAILGKLVADVERQGHVDAGIIGAKALLRALSEGGRTDLAYRIVSQPEMPGWAYWMTQGATTLWEAWKPGTSSNHIMFGDVSNWMLQWLAGIQPDPEAPGFERVLIRPNPAGDLTWAKGKHETSYGAIVSEWRKNAQSFELSVEIPANTGATVILPRGRNDSVTINGKRAQAGPLRIGSGKYEFVVKPA